MKLDLVRPNHALGKNKERLPSPIKYTDFEIGEEVAIRFYSNRDKWQFGTVIKRDDG